MERKEECVAVQLSEDKVQDTVRSWEVKLR